MSEIYEGTFKFIDLPKPPKTWPKADWGLDDYFMAGNDVPMLLTRTSDFKQTSEMSTWLEYFNTKFVFIKASSKIYDISENQLLSKQNFFDNYAPCRVWLGKDVYPVAAAWFTWAERVEVKGLAFRPGEDLITDNRLNTWQGFALEPFEDDKTVQRLWVNTILDAYGEEGWHLIHALACLVQNPGKRLSRFIFLGGKSGTGKNYAIEPIMRIMGVHGVSLRGEDVINKFNSNQAICRVGLINEPGDPANTPAANKVALGEMLKKNADANETTMQLEDKGVNAVTSDRLQFNIVISNYDPPFDLQPTDRRAVILKARQHMAIAASNNFGTKTVDYWNERWAWIEHENGSAAVMQYLLDLDISKVDMDGPAPVTEYKTQLLNNKPENAASFMNDFAKTSALMFNSILKEPLVGEHIFDAEIVVLVYSFIMQRDPENKGGFAAAIGKRALTEWEVTSRQISARIDGKNLGARVYLWDNGVIKSAVGYAGMTSTQMMENLVALRKAVAAGLA